MKRIITLLLAICMMASLTVVTSAAEETAYFYGTTGTSQPKSMEWILATDGDTQTFVKNAAGNSGYVFDLNRATGARWLLMKVNIGKGWDFSETTTPSNLKFYLYYFHTSATLTVLPSGKDVWNKVEGALADGLTGTDKLTVPTLTGDEPSGKVTGSGAKYNKFCGIEIDAEVMADSYDAEEGYLYLAMTATTTGTASPKLGRTKDFNTDTYFHTLTVKGSKSGDPNLNIADADAITSVAVRGTTATVTTNAGTGTAKLIAASYNGDEMEDVIVRTVNAADGNSLSVDISGLTGTTKKVFLWADDMITPLADTVAKNTIKESFDGKKVIFIGNSYVYYGNCVLQKNQLQYTWADRNNDKGYFYQLCKENGADVTVTNWCFSGHTIYNTFGGACDNGSADCKGVVHEDHLENRYFDYVFVSPHAAVGEEAAIAENFDYVINFFRQYNPNVKFICLGNHAVYGITNTGSTFPGITNYYATLAENGVIIADWGAIVRDIVKGNVEVPGATMEFTKTTFVNTNDGYHENALAGYLTALTAYCAITGEKAVGQPYEFCYDASLGKKYDLEAYRDDYYKNASDTNFIEVFKSEQDMKGLQQLVDDLLYWW